MGLLLTARKPTESNTLISYVHIIHDMHVVFCSVTRRPWMETSARLLNCVHLLSCLNVLCYYYYYQCTLVFIIEIVKC